MQEFIGLAYFAEIPAVIFDIQRGSPSTGMPTRTQQADIISCAYASHGDTKHVLLFPQDPNEAFTFAADALDLADRLQTPVFVMMDLDIGMNDWLVPPLEWDPARRYDRGKVMTYEDLEAGKEFGRYLDVDGDGIPYRTLPGTHPTRGAFFTRGTTKDEWARYTEEGRPYVDNMQRLLRKFETAKRLVPRPVKREAREADPLWRDLFRVELAGDGGSARSIGSARHPSRHAAPRAFPFHDEVLDFVTNHERVFVVEQNRDKQMRTLLDDRVGNRPGPACPDPALRRHPDHRAVHRQGDRRHARRRHPRPVAQGAAVIKWFLVEVPMTYIVKPKLHHPKLPTNALGYTHRDYEGSVSTLCAGCGHDSISAAIIQACFELALPPHRIAKLSGIGCSSKTPTYFLGQSHGFNSVHGRMPSVLTGANLANHDLLYLGVSGDGDSASIGLGQFAHCIRRGVNMVYIVENNGVYGLTKGQFSATADKGSKARRGRGQHRCARSIWWASRCSSAPRLVARSFSGDKAQLVPLIKAAMEHKGAAFIDVISPCVAFNNNPESTKSFDYVRAHNEAVNQLDFMVEREAITADYAPGTVETVVQHDGSIVRLRKLALDYDPNDRDLGPDLSAAAPCRWARSSPGCSLSNPITAICTTFSTRSRRRSTRSAKPSCAPARRFSSATTPRIAEPRPGRLTRRAVAGI